MLACRDLTVDARPGGPRLLEGVSAGFPAGGLHAIVGPSGSGKTTLIQALLRLKPATSGTVTLAGESLERTEQLAGQVGFAPQFSIAQPEFTVRETLRTALRLHVSDKAIHAERLQRVLADTGLAERADTRVGNLSGGQLRRLGLALEWVLDPAVLVCDEVTSGLDPRSEIEILDLLRTMQTDSGKTILCIIHNLSALDRFDSVTVLNAGRLVFQGTPDRLRAETGISDFLHLYDALPAERPTPGADDETRTALPEPVVQPGLIRQTAVLLDRRLRLFYRDRSTLLLTLAITLGFPCLVVIFALGGLMQPEGLALDRSAGFLERLREDLAYRIRAMETASLVTGLIMFQVILLNLIASNTGSREIAAERKLYEKERLAGLHPDAYAWSKIVFCSVLAVLQGGWMAIFVKAVCGFPGPWTIQTGLLALTTVAMTLTCLGLSALTASSERASLLSVYLVGFQLPLSGVVLALPDALVWICRPFINAFWGWSGYLTSMRESGLYDAYRLHHDSWLASPLIAAGALLVHALAGAALAFYGCHQKRWDQASQT
ncbi:MAG: ATP-binding cassette domain-containing protein [Opitutales bacterium]